VRAAAEANSIARFIDSGFVLLGLLKHLPIAAIPLARGGSATGDRVCEKTDGQSVEV